VTDRFFGSADPQMTGNGPPVEARKAITLSHFPLLKGSSSRRPKRQIRERARPERRGKDRRGYYPGAWLVSGDAMRCLHLHLNEAGVSSRPATRPVVRDHGARVRGLAPQGSLTRPAPVWVGVAYPPCHAARDPRPWRGGGWPRAAKQCVALCTGVGRV